MIKRSLIAGFAITAFIFGYRVMAQATPQAASTDRIVGEVTVIDAAKKQLTLKTGAGKTFLIKTDEKTQYRRVPPGETTLDRATTIAFADIAVGDKTIARGRVEADNVAAQSLIVVSAQEIAQKRQENTEEWKKRGIKGTIVGINMATGGMMVRMITATGTSPIRVSTEGRKVRYFRYPPDAVSFNDLKPGSFDDLAFGDQIRALGNRSEDGRMFLAEEIITGSFQMVGGTITAVNKETGEVTITNVKTKQPFTVVVRPDSKLRRLPAPLLKQMEDKLAAAPASGPGGGGMRTMRPGETPAQSSPSPSGGRVMAPGGGSGSSGGGGSPASSPAVDYGELIEKLPAITVADLKPGEGIIISSTKGADPARATALLLAAGVESFLKRQEENAKRPGFELDLALPGLGGP
ncbi:MAG: hypothetical protein LC794_19990 [Acidobacteria bacterium]|nr:hypothetical protein [Acidobacteriota bacterium]